MPGTWFLVFGLFFFLPAVGALLCAPRQANFRVQFRLRLPSRAAIGWRFNDELWQSLHIHAKSDVALTAGQILGHNPFYKFCGAVLTKILKILWRRRSRPRGQSPPKRAETIKLGYFNSLRVRTFTDCFQIHFAWAATDKPGRKRRLFQKSGIIFEDRAEDQQIPERNGVGRAVLQ